MRVVNCTLIYPHQLFHQHPSITKDATVVLIEDTLFFGDPRYPASFHKQKLILHRASMQAYAQQLRDNGREVRYCDYEPDKTADQHVQELIEEGFTSFRLADPCDDSLTRRITRACKKADVELTFDPTPMFMTPPDVGQEIIGKSAPYRMASFYIQQRKRFNILVKDDQPVGGAWSFDADNRKKWPKKREAPTVPAIQHRAWVAEATEYVEQQFPDNPGAVDPFVYPVTRPQARKWLERFCAERLVDFGTYEDAMVAEEGVLHHSVLTPALNIGLLTPQEVVDAVLDWSKSHDVPLNDLEGFIRQVIGWREFMQIMYREIGVKQRTSNFWDHKTPMPAAFYSGTTGIVPVDRVIQRLLDGAYTHHIERLMILGNFMLLCEIAPDDVYRWFMEMYIDAYDWVMVPNVYGMSQFADGGLLCTKPYISGSNYVRKMSDYPVGDWCAVWDGLFWRFIHRHRDFFNKQPRLSMMARQLDRMGEEKLKQHLAVAEAYLAELPQLG